MVRVRYMFFNNRQWVKKCSVLVKRNSLYIRANPHIEIQPETLILGSNISSGVTVPSFGKKFAKLRQCVQFEVQENISENKASV